MTELAHLDEMRTELIAVASHELRTPLTTLRMTLMMLQERAISQTERDRELVHTALHGVDQLAGTVDEFLDLTRIEAGQLRLNWGAVDLDELLEREAATARHACEEADVTLTVAVAARPECRRAASPRTVNLPRRCASRARAIRAGAYVRVNKIGRLPRGRFA